MKPYIRASLKLTQETQPHVPFLERFRHMWYHEARSTDPNRYTDLRPAWQQIRERKKGKKNDLIRQMSEREL